MLLFPSVCQWLILKIGLNKKTPENQGEAQQEVKMLSLRRHCCASSEALASLDEMPRMRLTCVQLGPVGTEEESVPSCVRVPRSVAGVLRGRGEAAGGAANVDAVVFAFPFEEWEPRLC